jgi:SAM-dependent methyltransferase
MSSGERNFDVFSSPDVVKHYANLSGLQPAESYAFENFVPQGASVLDIGVGCGRTTPYLAAKARRYVGIDYVKAMIDICAARFPANTFRCADATRLTGFENDSFDVVVISFNGIDAISTREDRLRCISEVFRVLAPRGRFIFSSHNSKMLLSLPNLNDAGPIRKVWRVARAAVKTMPYAARLLSSGSFRAGAGYYLDPEHGGIMHYCATPELVESDVCSTGFRLVEVIHNLHPRKVPRYFIASYYYVFAKPSTNPNEALTSLEVSSRAVSSASHFLPTSKNSFEQR